MVAGVDDRAGTEEEQRFEPSVGEKVEHAGFTVDEADIPALLAAWEKDANWMKQRPGFLSTQLHRAIGGSHMFMNYAVWDSVENFRAAFTHPDFVSALAAYPSSAVAQPHLFARVAVPNLCAA